jgi:hypothetical protein
MRIMSKATPLDNRDKALFLYTMLCGNKEASIKFLNEVGGICKIEDLVERKKRYGENLTRFLNERE